MSFNWNFYLYYNKDLYENGITTYQQALSHYNKNGKKENRICNPSDKRIYKYIKFKKNDLITFCNKFNKTPIILNFNNTIIKIE